MKYNFVPRKVMSVCITFTSRSSIFFCIHRQQMMPIRIRTHTTSKFGACKGLSSGEQTFLAKLSDCTLCCHPINAHRARVLALWAWTTENSGGPNFPENLVRRTIIFRKYWSARGIMSECKYSGVLKHFNETKVCVKVSVYCQKAWRNSLVSKISCWSN